MAGNQQEPNGAPQLDISNVVAAFTEEQVEGITGLTKSRLRYWSKTDFFKPSFVEENPRLPYSRFYSFKDVVALRTLEMLRVQHNVPLQHLRRVAEKLSHLKEELWTKTKIYAVNRRVVIENPESGRPEEVLSGQYLLGIPLKKVIEDTRKDVAKLKKRKDHGKISRSRSIVRNAWVVAGTRIPIGSIKRLYEDGYSINQIIEEYPDLNKEDVRAALDHPGGKAA